MYVYAPWYLETGLIFKHLFGDCCADSVLLKGQATLSVIVCTLTAFNY